MELPDFEEKYGEQLNDTIFNDYHLIEHFASDYPQILIQFSHRNRNASINHGEHFFYILNGLFADKSNPIFSEIRHYYNEPDKSVFIDELWDLRFEKSFQFYPQRDYQTRQPIISWLNSIISSDPSNLKEEISYFLRQFPQVKSKKYNQEIYEEKEIKRFQSRDTIYNTIQLFRILLVEYCFTNHQAPIMIDRPLVMIYSTWDYVEEGTLLLDGTRVVLNNDVYTLNEYYLKQLFYAYLSTYFLLQYAKPHRLAKEDEKHDSSVWPLKQLFAKLDSLLGKKGKVSDDSKLYYLETLFSLYFELPRYFKDNEEAAEICTNSLLWHLKDSLTDSPYGDVALIREAFNNAFEHFDFLEYNYKEKVRAKRFYTYLLPYTKKYEWRITHSIPE